MDIPDLTWQEIERFVIIVTLGDVAWRGVVKPLWKNRQKIADKLGSPKQPKAIRMNVGDSLRPTEAVSAEVTATWNTLARVTSSRTAIWNVESRDRVVDFVLEATSWALSEIVRNILR